MSRPKADCDKLLAFLKGNLPRGALGAPRLFYYDSLNSLDELLVRDGKFAGFAVGPRS